MRPVCEICRQYRGSSEADLARHKQEKHGIIQLTLYGDKTKGIVDGFYKITVQHQEGHQKIVATLELLDPQRDKLAYMEALNARGMQQSVRSHTQELAKN